jgi:hypothetical protein
MRLCVSRDNGEELATLEFYHRLTQAEAGRILAALDAIYGRGYYQVVEAATCSAPPRRDRRETDPE